MTKQLDIVEIGAPILKQKAKPVPDLSDETLQTLIDDMLVTLKKSNGVGIAAPQVNHALRIIIVASQPNERYPTAPLMSPVAMVNPTITHLSDEREFGWEGCLSVPGKRGFVPRSCFLALTYFDRKGIKREVEYTDFLARIVQHEIDHLDGICFVDRVTDTSQIVSEETYLNMIC